MGVVRQCFWSGVAPAVGITVPSGTAVGVGTGEGVAVALVVVVGDAIAMVSAA